jgi:hypothetical protein
LGKLFLREDGELINTHLVGLSALGVVLSNDGKVVVEDGSSIILLRVSFKVGFESLLPVIKFRVLLAVHLADSQ